MAIATNFSKEFYDKLGHEVVEEMVNWFNQTDVEYRTQLRDLNDRNYSRFEAKLEQRFSEQDAKWERRQNDQSSGQAPVGSSLPPQTSHYTTTV